MPIRILIADDHGLLRAGMRALLNSDPNLEVVGEAADGDETLRLCEALRPDIVLLDISMPGIDGIQVAGRLRETLPGVRSLMLTVHEDTGLLREALRAGASGYIMKRAVESELSTAIQAVWRGELYIHPAMTRALLASPSLEPIPPVGVVEPLSMREQEILQLIVKGYTNRQAAEELNLSVRTVESHRANIMDKLNLHSRIDLVRYANEHGLLQKEE